LMIASLGLGGDEGDESFAQRVNTEIETFQGESSDQDKIARLPTEHDCRRHILTDQNLGRSNGLGHYRAVRMLNSTCAERRYADLFQSRSAHLGEVGAGVYQALKHHHAVSLHRISDRELHVESPHTEDILDSNLRPVN